MRRWVEASQIPTTFDGIVGLLLKEQVHRVCSKELLFFLEEQQPKDIAELVNLAYRYVEVHRSDRKPVNINRNFGGKPNQAPEQTSSQLQIQKQSQTGNKTGYQPRTNPRRCYKRGSPGPKYLVVCMYVLYVGNRCSVDKSIIKLYFS